MGVRSLEIKYQELASFCEFTERPVYILAEFLLLLPLLLSSLEETKNS